MRDHDLTSCVENRLAPTRRPTYEVADQQPQDKSEEHQVGGGPRSDHEEPESHRDVPNLREVHRLPFPMAARSAITTSSGWQPRASPYCRKYRTPSRYGTASTSS